MTLTNGQWGGDAYGEGYLGFTDLNAGRGIQYGWGIESSQTGMYTEVSILGLKIKAFDGQKATVGYHDMYNMLSYDSKNAENNWTTFNGLQSAQGLKKYLLDFYLWGESKVKDAKDDPLLNRFTTKWIMGDGSPEYIDSDTAKDIGVNRGNDKYLYSVNRYTEYPDHSFKEDFFDFNPDLGARKFLPELVTDASWVVGGIFGCHSFHVYRK